MRAELTRMIDAHRRTLDQLTTGVAIFGSDQQAHASTTPPIARSGTSTPASSTRARPIRPCSISCAPRASCPSEQDFRQWKAALHEAYRAIEPKAHEWHLPDGRTMRVVTTPNPEGGVIYLFDDVTERLDLERRYDALIRVQGETLDNLAEGVAVFGSDGRLRLYNPAFARCGSSTRPRSPSGRTSRR